MAVQVSYPGVYIDEFTPGAPIQGVATNIAALVGVALRGPLDRPTRVTSWEQFQRVFGDEPVPGFYLWYAARGFFENGGTVCYVVRASDGDYDEASFDNRAGSPAIIVRARQPGVSGISVGVTEQHRLIAANTSLYRPAGVLQLQTGRDIELQPSQAWRFRAGDEITIAALGERRRVVRISGNVLRVSEAFVNAYAAGAAVRLADTQNSTRIVRLVSTVPVAPDALVTGTLLNFDPGGANVGGVVDSVQTEFMSDPLVPATTETSYRVTLRSPLGTGFSLDPGGTATPTQSEELRITVQLGGPTHYDNLAIDPAHPRYFVRIVNEAPAGLVEIQRLEPPPPTPLPENTLAGAALLALAGGAAENLAVLADVTSAVADAEFINALDTLRAIDEVTLIAIPDRRTAPVQQALVDHCQQLMDRFAIVDSNYDFSDDQHTDVEQQRTQLASERGYAALYYPWLRVSPKGSGEPMLAPPSGHVCGIIARSDASKGVHKAPANEIVNGAVGVERRMNKTDHGLLNLESINVIEQSGIGRPVLMGARTTATDLNWLHVSTRRLFNYLEESIQEGIRWAIFEPNNLQLWQKLRRSITDFLTRAWRDGALFGKTAEEAFYVRIDEELNPFSEQQLGRLYIEIGLRPTYPAEFIIVRIGIWPGGAEVSEG
ncbi:phage tail sheath subtilisin-like domain-containing protein [Lysobacter sp. CFH 32150]|uniref:phage tail sheath subtilisin-like domain-containing protein n=1 Tax=Lysobacter sp. CFH 32150 TaxID=2927128 RepID=UPI001FA7628B|nr:phage tail sheath subtilisin-like domain-containing protein [Lysobacter sp. CFH 32150]MCI4567341.1 phage tail sheath subtilisin-like domain-containing protein [Lysobacter sp. CFH 32150]